MKTTKKWVIKFKEFRGDDFHTEHILHYRKEILDENNDVVDYGEIMTFTSKEKAQEFLNTLDSREFDRWVEEIK